MINDPWPTTIGSPAASARKLSDLQHIGPSDFARCFGIPIEELPVHCLQIIEQEDFSHRQLRGAERDRVILNILTRIEADAQDVGSPGRKDVWERCWSENLEIFEASGDTSKLVPKFIQPEQPVRLNGDFVMPAAPHFELNCYRVLRGYLFEKYFQHGKALYEFGCGSGFNLVAAAQLLPRLRLYGLDWATASCQLVNDTAKRLQIKLEGRLFDFLSPNENLTFDDDGMVLTVCALEQVGKSHGNFIDFLLRKKPRLCVHIEPIIELYDPGRLSDYLAIRYHQHRGYLQGFLTRLQELELLKKIRILEVRRPYFGGLFHEAYSFVVWELI